MNVEASERADLGGLVAPLYEPLLRFARRRVGADLAEDIVQETMLCLLRMSPQRLSRVTPPYAMAIAANLIRRHFSRGSGRPGLASDVAARGAGSADEDRAEAAALAAQLAPVMSLLPDGHHVALRLAVCSDVTVERAAGSMHVSAATLNNWRHRGIERLRRAARTADRTHLGATA